MPSTTPASSTVSRSAGSCRRWKASMRVAARSSAAASSGGMAFAAASISSRPTRRVLGGDGVVVVLLRQRAERFVAAGAHGGDDGGDLVVHAGGRFAGFVQQGGEGGREAGVGGVVAPHAASAARKRSIQAPMASGWVFRAVRLTISRLDTWAMTSLSPQAVGGEGGAGLHQVHDQAGQAEAGGPAPSRRSDGPRRHGCRGRRSAAG